MLWNICLFVAVAALGGAFGISLYLATAGFRRGRRIKPIHVLGAGFFIACFALCMPAYIEQYRGEAHSLTRALVFNLQRSVKVFGTESVSNTVYDQISHSPDSFKELYLALIIGIQFFAPMLTFGFLLSLIKNFSAGLRYRMSYFREVYVFSRMNEQAMLLARDLMKKHPRAQMVFCSCTDESEKASGADEAAREMEAICFKKAMDKVNWSFHGRKKALFFFAISRDEQENLEMAHRMTEDLGSRENTHLYFFSEGEEGTLLMSALKREKMRVRRVNMVHSLVLRTLYENGDRLFKQAKPVSGSDEKQISAVIVGLGKYGTEMLKSLVWYGQMDGYRLKINAFDGDGLAEEKLAAQCPELLDEKLNGKKISGEAFYDITVHSGFPVGTKKFADKIAGIRDATYVFVALDGDEENLAAAAEMRMRFARNGCSPEICALFRGDRGRALLTHAVNHAGQPYDLRFVGDMETTCTEGVIMASEVEQMGFACHRAYCEGRADREEDFWRYEYCYHSSLAVAIHGAARKKLGLSGASGELEHKRWNAYMRSQGYVYGKFERGKNKDVMARQHRDLVPYQQLPGYERPKDERVSGAV